MRQERSGQEAGREQSEMGREPAVEVPQKARREHVPEEGSLGLFLPREQTKYVLGSSWIDFFLLREGIIYLKKKNCPLATVRVLVTLTTEIFLFTPTKWGARYRLLNE